MAEVLLWSLGLLEAIQVPRGLSFSSLVSINLTVVSAVTRRGLLGEGRWVK